MSSKLKNLVFDNSDFLWFEKRIEALKELSYEDFLSFAKTHLSKDNKKRLAVLFEGQIDNDFKYKLLDEID